MARGAVLKTNVGAGRVGGVYKLDDLDNWCTVGGDSLQVIRNKGYDTRSLRAAALNAAFRLG